MPAPRRFSCQLLVQLVLLSLPPFGKSSELDNDGDIVSKPPIDRYYFTREIDFLAKQSMILGDHPGAAGRTTTDVVDGERIARLRFIEKSLRMELDYVRRLRSMKNGTKSGDEKERDVPEIKKSMKGKSKDFIVETISGATWPVAGPVRHPPEEEEGVDHEYDYDRAARHGFGRMHRELECEDHAYDQEKPIYTPEMWRRMWKAFRDSTLFPFPIPDSNECPDLPYYVDQTSDNKGRGNFAKRNITSGDLVHAGHPKTVFFLDAESWYRFVTSLPTTMMVCDVMEWAWQQDMTNTGNMVHCMNMDEAVFFNDGEQEELNMKLGQNALDYYASRDIEKGEELLYDYSRFADDISAMDL